MIEKLPAHREDPRATIDAITSGVFSGIKSIRIALTDTTGVLIPDPEAIRARGRDAAAKEHARSGAPYQVERILELHDQCAVAIERAKDMLESLSRFGNAGAIGGAQETYRRATVAMQEAERFFEEANMTSKSKKV